MNKIYWTEKRRLIALFLSVSAALSLCACGKNQSPTSQISIDDIVIGDSEKNKPAIAQDSNSELKAEYAADGSISYSAPLYILFMQDPFSEIQTAYNLNYDEVTTADVMLSDGTVCTGSQYVSSNADEEFKWMYVINHLYNQYGLKDEDSSGYTNAVYYAGQTYKENADYYKNFNITMADLLNFYLYQYKTNDLFIHEYGSSSEKAIPEEELAEMMEKGAYRFEYILLPYYDISSSKPLDEAEIQKRKNIIADFAERAEEGTSFEDLVYESYLYLDPKTEKNSDPSYYENYITADNSSFLEGIMNALAGMQEGEMLSIDQGSYCSLIKKLPVNETKDLNWKETAMQLAYASDYGTEFDENLIKQFNSIEINYNETFRSALTPEYYAKMLDKFYKQ